MVTLQFPKVEMIDNLFKYPTKKRKISLENL